MNWLRQRFSRHRRDIELSQSVREHLDEKVTDLMDRGMTRKQAESAAHHEFGNVTPIEERSRKVWQRSTIQAIWADIRFATRQLRRAPAFSMTVILTLALGIGASTAIFSLVESFLLKPLPYPHANRLVMVWEQLRALGIRQLPASVGDFIDYRDQNRVFEEMAAVQNAHFVLGSGEHPERVYAVQVTANLFPMMEMGAALGRVLTAEDNQPGHDKVAVLSYGLWRERFGGDPAVIGHNVVLDGRNYEVVGVLERGVRFSVGYPRTPQLWVPLALAADPQRSTGQLAIVARLRPDVTLEAAQVQMSTLADRLEREYHIDIGPHGEDPGYGVVVTPLREELTGNLREPLLLMLGATALIFLIICANIANLMLTHGLSREREFAIRISLGAGVGRLLRLLMAESALLVLVGLMAGIGTATAVSTLLVRLSPYKMAILLGNSMDAKVLGYAAGLGVAAAILFGLAPALMLVRRGRRMSPERTGQQIVGAQHRQVTRRILVIAETAMAAALTIGAGLLIHSFVYLRTVPLGFEPASLLTAEINLPPSYSNGVMQREFYKALLERAGSEPGVEAVAATTILPVADPPLHDPFSVEGRPWRPLGAERVPQFMNHQAVSTEYFRTMGIALREGRVFTSEDTDESQRVAIVNETMVRGFWPGENPIGKHVMAGAPQPGVPWLTVVGVVADVRSGGATIQAHPELYTPMAQTPASAMALVVRTKKSDVAMIARELRDCVQALDGSIPLENIAAYNDLLAGQLAPRRYEMLLLAAFGGLALLLSAIGLYGVVSYAVTQRTPEIGLRIALGASRRDVVQMVLRQALWLAVCGVGLGITIAAIFRHVLASAIFGIRLIDLQVYGGVAVLLLGIALAAALVPARRAAAIDPMQALRAE